MGDKETKKLITPKTAYELSVAPVIAFPTPFTPQGAGVSTAFKIGLNKNYERFSVGLEFRYVDLKSKLHEYSNSDIRLKNFSLRALMSHAKLRALGKNKVRPWGIFRTETDKWIGFGKMWQPGFTFDPRGESIDASGAGEYGMDIGSTSRGGIDIRLGNTVSLFLGGEFSLGVRWAPGDSMFSSLFLQLGFVASLVFGGKATTEHEKDETLGKFGLATALMFKAIEYGQRGAMEEVLTGAVQDARDWGLMGGGGDPGSLFHVPMLLSATSFMGGASKGTSLSHFMSVPGDWRWAIFTSELMGGLFLLSKASKGSAVADMVNSLSMLLYTGYKIDTPSRRKSLSQKELKKKARDVLLWRFFLSMAATVVGAAAGSDKPGNTWAGAPLHGGLQGGIAAALTPIPFQAKGMGADTAIYITPITGYWSKDKKGRRGGFTIRSEIKDSPILVGANLMTPSFSALNLVNLAQPGEPYDDTTLPSHIQAFLGLYKRWPYFSIWGAVSQTMLMGGSGLNPGGFGAKAGMEINIPIGSIELLLGGDCGVSFLPKDNWQAECGGNIGLRIKPSK